MSNTASSAAPEVDHAGIAVGGNIKAIYQVKSMCHKVDPDGAIIIDAHTTCGRTISTMKHPGEDPLYEVAVSNVGDTETERSYSGKEGSDAHRIFNGYTLGWEKTKKEAEEAS